MGKPSSVSYVKSVHGKRIWIAVRRYKSSYSIAQVESKSAASPREFEGRRWELEKSSDGKGASCLHSCVHSKTGLTLASLYVLLSEHAPTLYFLRSAFTSTHRGSTVMSCEWQPSLFFVQMGEKKRRCFGVQLRRMLRREKPNALPCIAFGSLWFGETYLSSSYRAVSARMKSAGLGGVAHHDIGTSEHIPGLGLIS